MPTKLNAWLAVPPVGCSGKSIASPTLLLNSLAITPPRTTSLLESASIAWPCAYLVLRPLHAASLGSLATIESVDAAPDSSTAPEVASNRSTVNAVLTPDTRCRHELVPVLRPPWSAVAHRELCPPQLAQVVEVTARGDAADAGRLRHRSGRQPRLRPAKHLDDEIQGCIRKSLGQGFVPSRPQRSENPVNIALLGLADARHPHGGGRVGQQLFLKAGKEKGLDQILHDSAAYRGAQAVDVARRSDRDHVDRRVVTLAQLL